MDDRDEREVAMRDARADELAELDPEERAEEEEAAAGRARRLHLEHKRRAARPVPHFREREDPNGW